MEQSEFIAAVDIGTSKIVAMVAKRNEQGILSIIASEKEESGTCIRRGCVYNVEETANKIKSLISKLNFKLNPRIKKIYVGIGGQSLRTEIHSVFRDIDGATVDEILIRSLYDECKSYNPEFVEILDIVSPEFYLDGRPEMKPVGVQCSRIEARFKLILGRPSLKRNLHKSISEKAGIEIAGYIISPIATATAVLTDTELELGCALIEFGAGTTCLSIYKGGLLKYLVNIPLGGNVITKDLCNLNILEKEAEDLKVNFGSAMIGIDNKTKIQTAKLAEGLYGSREIELNSLNNIIEARFEEIIVNVKDQISASGFSQSLGSGIVITGGGASLNNISESIKNKTGYEVRLAAAKRTLVNQAAELAQQYANSEVIGLLALGNDNCAEIIEQAGFFDKPMQAETTREKDEKRATEKPKEKKQGVGFFRKISRGFEGMSKTLFDEDE